MYVLCYVQGHKNAHNRRGSVHAVLVAAADVQHIAAYISANKRVSTQIHTYISFVRCTFNSVSSK